MCNKGKQSEANVFRAGVEGNVNMQSHQRRVSGTSGETHDRAREHINGSCRGCEGRRAVQSRSEEQSKSGRSLITGPSWKESKIVGGLQEILVKHTEK